MGYPIGEKLKKTRKQHKMTQAQLATLYNVSSSSIGMYEQNLREPDLEFLVFFAKKFQISLDDLLDLPPRPSDATSDIGIADHEIDLVHAYRSNPELQGVVDHLLGIARDDAIPVFAAAHSKDNHPPQIAHISKEKWEEILHAPETTDPLL